MIVFQERVFEDYVPDPTPVYTGIQHCAGLASGDLIGIFVAIDDLFGGGSISVTIEHSSDGRNFVTKNTSPSSPELNKPLGPPNTFYGGEQYPARPSLEFVRFKIALAGGIPAPMGRVQVFAVVEDRRGSHGRHKRGLLSHGSADQYARRERAGLLAARPMHVFNAVHEAAKKLPSHLSEAARLQAAVGTLDAGMRFELEEYGELVRSTSFGAVMDVTQSLGGLFAPQKP